MKRICVIDGGGAKGVIPLVVLKAIEEKTGRPFHETFDLVVGSSIGAIIGGTLSTGIISASAFLEKFLKELPSIFHKRLRIPLYMPIYSREPAVRLLSSTIGGQTPMKFCRTKFMCTSVCLQDERTHFFKSWEEKDGKLGLVRALNRSYAAPWYFGMLKEDDTKTDWLDGAIGTDSCPVVQAYIEAGRLSWRGEPFHILSLGCGEPKYGIAYKTAKWYFNFQQTMVFLKPVQGGLARAQSTADKVFLMKSETAFNPNMSFQRLDITDMPKSLDKMDAVKHAEKYLEYGKKLAQDVDYTKL